MTNITDFTQLFYAQWERPGAENPKLDAATAADGLSFLFTKPLTYADGVAIPVGEDFIMGVKKRSTGYTEGIRVNSGEMASDGLSITLASIDQRGIELAPDSGGGIDLSVGIESNRVLLEADSEVRIPVSALHMAQVSGALLGTIGSTIKHNARETFDITKTDIAAAVPVYADAATGEAAITSPVNGDSFYATTEGVVREYIGGAWGNSTGVATPNASETVSGKVELATNAEMGTSTSTGGTGARLMPANDQLVKASSGAVDENKLAVLESDGAFAPGFIPAQFTVPTGIVWDYMGASAPTSWLLLNGDTLGSAGSGATHAGTDNQTLYEFLWDNLTDTNAPVSTGRGASASADFAANKTLTMPDAAGKVSAMLGGTAFSALGKDDIGEETHTLTAGEIPAHTHQQKSINNQPAYTSIGGSGGETMGSDFATTPTTPINTASNTGGGGAHANNQPSIVVNKIIKL